MKASVFSGVRAKGTGCEAIGIDVAFTRRDLGTNLFSKVVAMIVAATKSQSLADRTLAVREHWSQAERLRRAIAGNRLSRIFAGRFASETLERAIWAVGSLSPDDLSRLAQNG